MSINKNTAFNGEWFRLFQGGFYLWQKNPLQPLFKLQGIHAERLFAGQGIAIWTDFVPFAIDSQGRFYFKYYVGDTIWNIMHYLDYTFLLAHFNNARYVLSIYR